MASRSSRRPPRRPLPATTQQSMLTPPPPSPAPSSAAIPGTPATELASRIDSFAMDSPSTTSTSTSRRSFSPGLPSLHADSFFAQNSTILMAGLSPASSPSPLPSSRQPLPGGSSQKKKKPSLQRRRPPPPPQPKRLQAPLLPMSPETAAEGSPPPPSTRPHAPLRRRLTPLVTAKGSSPLQHHPALVAPSPRALSPCVSVKATSLQRADDNNSSNSRKRLSWTTTPTTPPPESGRLHVAALVRPMAAGREPFAIEREFALPALLDAVPQRDARGDRGSVSILPSPLRSPQRKGERTPLRTLRKGENRLRSPVGGIKRSPGGGIKRPSPEDDDNDDDNNNNDSTRVRRSGQKSLPSPDRFRDDDGGIPIPYVPHPALGALPALAAVILSGYVKPGDAVELPMPHPEAWPQTVSHIYAGDGRVTEAMRQNIVHLGGKA